VNGAAGRLDGTDRLLVGYALGVAALVAVAGDGGIVERRWAVFHVALSAVIWGVSRLDRAAGRGASAWSWLHRWLPVVALPWLYDAAGRLRHLVVARDLDPWIERWDAALFPGRWYLAGARLPVPAVELAHAVYFSYYLLLFVPALVAERRGPGARREVDRYLFTLTATLLAHYALNFALPVAGPLAARAAAMPEGALFLPLMDALYLAFDRGGLAFPSTHVAVAVVAGWFAARRFFPGRALLFVLWSAAVAASTVVCGYHYPIDVLAGLATGGLAVALAARAAREGGDGRERPGAH